MPAAPGVRAHTCLNPTAPETLPFPRSVPHALGDSIRSAQRPAPGPRPVPSRPAPVGARQAGRRGQSAGSPLPPPHPARPPTAAIEPPWGRRGQSPAQDGCGAGLPAPLGAPPAASQPLLRAAGASRPPRDGAQPPPALLQPGRGHPHLRHRHLRRGGGGRRQPPRRGGSLLQAGRGAGGGGGPQPDHPGTAGAGGGTYTHPRSLRSLAGVAKPASDRGCAERSEPRFVLPRPSLPCPTPVFQPSVRKGAELGLTGGWEGWMLQQRGGQLGDG